MITRRRAVKTVLWAIIGVLGVLTVARFARGLGPTTGLSDAAPWGFWIAFDVMAGVALAAGGFVLAATVYIFRIEKYRSFARPAILTAFLGYAAVAAGLMYDLGLPWHIWHPVVFPQPRSVLFEVAMCVILYLAVLFLEFSPVLLEHPLFDRPIFRSISKTLKKTTIVLVISGIVLSTLHQSSLGSLFLIAPHRVHPLWYSPIIWILFFVSAVGLGLMMVTLESFFSAWFFGHRLRLDLLSGLGKAASAVLFLYTGVRLTDLAARGVLVQAFDGSLLSFLFLFEMLLSAILPALLLAIPGARRSSSCLLAASLMTVFGMIGYRFDVCIVSFARPEGMSYFPTWAEVAVSLGIVAGAMIVFIFFVEKLRVYPEEHALAQKMRAGASLYQPGSLRTLLPDAIAGPRRYSLAAVLGASMALVLLPSDALLGATPKQNPVFPTRTVDGIESKRIGRPGHDYRIAGAKRGRPNEITRVPLMVIDGNRDGRLVLFPHDVHQKELGIERSCAVCHHQSLPFQKNSACSDCHRDMYSETDVFNHSRHIERLEGNRGCTRCHPDPSKVKTRDTATSCIECHEKMVQKGSFVKPERTGLTGFAAGYMDAMHGLCIACHRQKAKRDPQRVGRGFAGCAGCHRGAGGDDLLRTGPYAPLARKGGAR